MKPTLFELTRRTQLAFALCFLAAPITPRVLAQAGPPQTSVPAPPALPATRSPFADWMSWEYVGDPGNPPSPFGPGSVATPYWIGKYEVTNRQYAEFLNAKAALGDPLGLYDVAMGLDSVGGIERTGSGLSTDPYNYRPRLQMAEKPVNFVSFYDALRFANWMHNGRGVGDTETGAYTLVGGTAVPQNGMTVVRQPDARVVIPTQHEWYKAGHYRPSNGAYMTYATGSHQLPTPAAATPTGDVANPGLSVVNYMLGADWAGQDGHVTTVGSAGSLSESFYNCADMNGNVSEWNETKFLFSNSMYRMNRGGDYKLDASIMQPGHFGIVLPHHAASTIGFRVVRTAP